MNKFFLTNVRYEKVLESGLMKMVTESYIVDALSFTEAEARTIEEVTPFISGEFSVTAAKIAKLSEVIPADDEAFDNAPGISSCSSADKWYKVRIDILTLDEKTGGEKRTKCDSLIQAADLCDAIARYNYWMRGTMVDYELVTVSETPIMDVYFYTEKSEKQES